MRMREWRELHRQLLPVVEALGWSRPVKPADYEAIHRAILAGLPTSVARKGEKGLYEGTRSRGFAIFPGSALARSAPNWLLSLSVIVTSRQYAHGNARIEPHWLYDQAGHLLKRTVFEPHWDRDRGRVIAYEQATLYGLVIHGRKRVDYALTDPAGAHQIFLREGLAECNLESRSDFVADNARVLERAYEEGPAAGGPGHRRTAAQLLLVPETIASTRDLDRWYRILPEARRKRLRWRLEDLLATSTREQAFPAHLELAGHRFRLDYLFEPGHPADGVTLTVPLAWLNALPLARLEWLVPGMLKDKVTELIRSLPKSLRRNFVPAPDFAQAFVESSTASERPLLHALTSWMTKTTGIAVAVGDFQTGELPAHLVMRLRLLDENARELANGRDGHELQRRYGARARSVFAARAGSGLARTGLTRFEPDQLPDSITSPAGMRAWPAFVDRGEHVDLVVFESADAAARAHAGGIRRLLQLHLADQRRRLARQLPLDARAQFTWAAIGSLETLRQDIVDHVLDRRLDEEGTQVRDLERFRQLAAAVSTDLARQATQRALLVEAALDALSPIGPGLTPPLMGFAAASFDDIREQLADLFPPDLGRRIRDADLAEYPRYLRAVALRVERLQQDPCKDQERMLVVHDFQQRLASLPEPVQSSWPGRRCGGCCRTARLCLPGTGHAPAGIGKRIDGACSAERSGIEAPLHRHLPARDVTVPAADCRSACDRRPARRPRPAQRTRRTRRRIEAVHLEQPAAQKAGEMVTLGFSMADTLNGWIEPMVSRPCRFQAEHGARAPAGGAVDPADDRPFRWRNAARACPGQARRTVPEPRPRAGRRATGRVPLVELCQLRADDGPARRPELLSLMRSSRRRIRQPGRRRRGKGTGWRSGRWASSVLGRSC